MKKRLKSLAVVLVGISISGLASEQSIPPSNGIAYPTGWQDWATIAVSHRNDNNTLRVILGNEVAVAAARSGNTNPWPDGAIVGKVVWKETALEHWQAAAGPGEFVHAEFMFKDSETYADTHGWGWARWVGQDQVPFDNGMQVCIACHTPVKDRDWVFTDPGQIPQ
ncbi:MAG: cytochrome P460 family protein [Gammaproteobacteria bacterium]|nr:cytochrome P460 family protein [Gammaproteobacteria bacterium]